MGGDIHKGETLLTMGEGNITVKGRKRPKVSWSLNHQELQY